VAWSSICFSRRRGSSRQAIDLITERGFNRGRDLPVAWAKFVADYSGD